MQLTHYSIDQLKGGIKAIVEKYLDSTSYKIFFFGSRVSGKEHERSDIDLGIEGQEPVPGHIMTQIRDELENLPTLYKIDVVDFKRVPEGFSKIALEHMEFLK